MMIYNHKQFSLTDSSDNYNNNKNLLGKVDYQITTFVVNGTSGVIKLIVKIGVKEVAFQVGKLYSMKAGKLASKIAVKNIPIVGFGLATLFSLNRLKDGECIKAVGEALSGLLPFLGSYGVVGSVALDVLMISHDVQRFFKTTEKEILFEEDGEEYNVLTLQKAYTALRIKIANPKKEQVDSSFNKIINELHSDRKENLSKISFIDDYEGLTKTAIACKELIYKEHGWI